MHTPYIIITISIYVKTYQASKVYIMKTSDECIVNYIDYYYKIHKSLTRKSTALIEALVEGSFTVNPIGSAEKTRVKAG